jgi:hypothetical protein
MEEGEEEVEMGYDSGCGMLHLVGWRVCDYPCGTEVPAGGIRRMVGSPFLLSLNPRLNGFDRCDGYNLATAFACLAWLLFGLSVFFDIKDLYGSRVSPRTRT